MRIISRIRAKNFGIYKSLDLFLEPGIGIISGRNNYWNSADSSGAGKSTIPNIVCWCLTGRTMAGSTKDAIVRHTEKMAMAEVTLASYPDLIDELTVVRVFPLGGPEKLSFTFQGMEYPSSIRIKDNQKRLDEYLGANFFTLMNSCFLEESNPVSNILRCYPSDRAKLLEPFINAAVYEEASKFIKEFNTEIDKNIATNKVIIDTSKERIVSLESEISEYEDIIYSKEQAYEQLTTHSKREFLRIKREAAQAKAIIAEEIPSMEKAVDDKRKLDVLLNEEQTKLTTAQAVLDTVGEIMEPGVCPTCKQTISEQRFEALRRQQVSHRETIIQSQKLVRQYKQEIALVVEEMDFIRDKRTGKLRAKDKLAELSREAILLKEKQQPPDLKFFKQMLAEKLDLLQQQKEDIDKYSKKNKKYTETMIMAKELRKYLKSDIKNFLLDRIRKKLTVYANKHCSVYTDDEFGFEFPPTTEKGDERFEIWVFRHGQRVDPKVLSGGEQWRLKWCFLLALRDIQLEQAHTRLGFLFIDDSLGPLDETGTKEVFSGVREEKFPQVIFCVPKESMLAGGDWHKVVIREKDEATVH